MTTCMFKHTLLYPTVLIPPARPSARPPITQTHMHARTRVRSRRLLNNNNISNLYSAFLSTQRRFTWGAFHVVSSISCMLCACVVLYLLSRQLGEGWLPLV